MQRCCLNCRHWCGTKYSTWGGCSYIIKEVAPWINKYKSVFGWNVTLPFDTHDVKYFEGLNTALLYLAAKELPDLVRKGIRREEDLKFILSQYDGEVIGERIAPIRLVYFETHKDKEGCDYYE